MPIEIMQANPKVRANAGKVAIMRGPVVFCLEETDNSSNLPTVALPQDANLNAAFDENLLGGTMVITGEAMRVRPGQTRRFVPTDTSNPSIKLLKSLTTSWNTFPQRILT